ncbi:MAG: peptidoglycan DD-metalloendopeptidase family protein [Spirochaetaceae bacterium]|jgi:murein DD-endopeptidase MepM/ murein hydrolase activator NlpD|nr:peptidoglycan DD-metalloendopeptidase family protein [Spirochaetaceae bacterium]
MLVIFRKFAVTNAALKVLSGALLLVLATLLIAGQGKSIKAEVAPEDSIGGRESAVTAELVSLETGGLSEPEEFTQPRMLLFSSYRIQQGDVLGEVAKNFGLSTGTLISVNNIKNTRALQIGQTIRVPNQDGIFYTVKKGDSLESIASRYKAEVDEIRVANELFSGQINPNTSLFLPGAALPWEEEQEINGDLFLWPVRGRLSSYYGYRRSPFTGARSFHDGLDIAAPSGTPIKAAMAGRVKAVGYDNTYGNFVVLTHSSGYSTLYGHMSSIGTRSGAYVNPGTIIGYVGNTGLSTGPHLHFTVYKNGSSINPRTVLR